MAAKAPHSDAERIAKFMGISAWAGMDDVHLVERVESGLPVSTVRAIIRRIDPRGELLNIHDLIPKATYYRRKEQNKPLTKDQSEMIFALSKVFSEVIRIYDNDLELAALFLSRKHALLGDRSPLDMARESTAGADLVLKLLARAEAGVAA